eukprot:6000005-Amphidinium_carterae.1
MEEGNPPATQNGGGKPPVTQKQTNSFMGDWTKRIAHAKPYFKKGGRIATAVRGTCCAVRNWGHMHKLICTVKSELLELCPCQQRLVPR